MRTSIHVVIAQDLTPAAIADERYKETRVSFLLFPGSSSEHSADYNCRKLGNGHAVARIYWPYFLLLQSLDP